MEEIEFKRDVHRRLLIARSEGITFGLMEYTIIDRLGMTAVLNVLEGWKMPLQSWENVDKMLKDLGY